MNGKIIGALGAIGGLLFLLTRKPKEPGAAQPLGQLLGFKITIS